MDMRTRTLSETVDNYEKKPIDLEDALTVVGFGRYNLIYCFVLALFLVAAIVEPIGYAYLLPVAKCDLQISDAQRGFIASVPYIGIVITSYPWGYIVDTKGRKFTVICSSLAAGFFGVLSAFMPNQISFTVCKFLTALCIAGPAAVPYSFIGEITPRAYRDVTLSVTNAFQIMGAAVVPLLAWAILPLDFNVNFGAYYFRSWRLLTIVNSLLFLVAAFLMMLGPESPKYLVAQGKHDEALAVLQTFYARNKRKSPEDFPVKMLIMPDNSEQKRSFLISLKEQSLPLFKPPLLKWMALTGFLLFGIFATLNGLYVWIPDILNRVFSGSEPGLTACGVIAQRLNETAGDGGECNDTIEVITFIVNVVAGFSCAVLALAASSLVKFIGKKALLVIMFFLIGTFCILVNFITNNFVFAALLSSMTLMGCAIGPVNAFGVDIFPTQFRGMAISLAMMFGRLGSVVGANVAGLLLNSVCEATFFVFGGLLIFCGFLSFLLPRSQPPPTKSRMSIKSPNSLNTRL